MLWVGMQVISLHDTRGSEWLILTTLFEFTPVPHGPFMANHVQERDKERKEPYRLLFYQFVYENQANINETPRMECEYVH